MITPVELIDNGGRRSGVERRRYSYSSHIPERRSGEERRSGKDRRDGVGKHCNDERRAIYKM